MRDFFLYIFSGSRNEQTADEKRANIALEASLITVLGAPSSISLSSILRAHAAEKSIRGRLKWRDSVPGNELNDYSDRQQLPHQYHQPHHQQQLQQQQQQQESLHLLEFNQHEDDRCLDRADCWFYNKNNKCFKADNCMYRHCYRARESTDQCQGFLMSRRCPDPMRCNRRHDLQPAALRFTAAAPSSHHMVEESLVELDLNNPDLLDESALETSEISKVVAQCGVSRAKAVRALNQSANKSAHGAFLVRAPLVHFDFAFQNPNGVPIFRRNTVLFSFMVD